MERPHAKDPVYTFDDDDDEDEDGIPTLVDDSPTSKPPVVPKQVPSRKESHGKNKTEFSSEDAKAVFTIDGEGFDVILSEDKGKIFWSPMSASEIAHNEFVKQALAHLNFDDYDCIACMGGDGSVTQVVDALMNRSQKEKGVDLKTGTSAAAAALVPIGIIPIGRTNHVAFSLMGVNDPVTGALHIIYGNYQPVDVCSMITPEKVCRWGFNSQYGFAGQVLTYLKRYKALGSKRIDAAIIKALTKAKLRAYECEIEYIPAENQRKGEQMPCTTGCPICMEVSKNDNVADLSTDVVQELDPLNQSFTSNTSSVIDLPQDSPWKIVKGKYMNVGMFAIPGRTEMAPQGLSKYTHLSDGTVDLILVKETERKEFVRHLKRHSNSKNQNDFPFIEVIKAKEIRFRPRYPTGWNYNDHDFSEIKYQMEREGSKLQHQESMEVINDLERANSISTLDISDDEEDDSDNEEKEAKPQMLGPQYRRTFTEIEVERRRKIARKKEEKQKAREESKMLSIWNIDNQQIKTLELDFK
ncbi:ceramide kinase-like protein [Elysia marginata]|uniref:Ceramide kinase-like protein n=1 Tax=Elysia marginata TaxID=1093978 RepID=A0AAV4IWL6_9GAST|nr:ceramide kinase-like protein [Elysia marginata]